MIATLNHTVIATTSNPGTIKIKAGTEVIITGVEEDVNTLVRIVADPWGVCYYSVRTSDLIAATD